MVYNIIWKLNIQEIKTCTLCIEKVIIGECNGYESSDKGSMLVEDPEDTRTLCFLRTKKSYLTSYKQQYEKQKGLEKPYAHKDCHIIFIPLLIKNSNPNQR